MTCGLLLVDKPRGIRSTSCVTLLRRHLGKSVKVGHGGTLDSTAEGLLVLLAGTATRTSDTVMALPKVYHAEIRFGEERSTDDASGEVLLSGPVPSDLRRCVEDILPSFYGVRLQVPPEISAVKVRGRRASDRSRRGEKTDLAARPVYVQSISILPSQTDPDVCALRILCGKGTYVRSIARDLGRCIGCGAHVGSLVRKSIGTFSLEEALPYSVLQTGGRILRESVLPLHLLTDQLYSYHGDSRACKALADGRQIPVRNLRFRSAGTVSFGNRAAVIGEGMLSIGTVRSPGVFEPKSNIFLGETP